MAHVFPVLMLSGEEFSPRHAEEVTGLTLSQKDEPGTVGGRGRLAGQFGGAFLDVPPDVRPDRRLAWLLEAAERHLPALRGAGVTLCKFHLDVRWWEQCNLEFRPDELARISALGVLFTISCWDYSDQPEPDETP